MQNDFICNRLNRNGHKQTVLKVIFDQNVHEFNSVLAFGQVFNSAKLNDNWFG